MLNEVQNHIFKVDTTCIKNNQVLAMSVNRQDIERSGRFIRQYGLLMPPVLGNFKDGTQMVLSGECELMALKEIGVKMVDAVAVPIITEVDADKLTLLLSCLRKSPNALSEAILISQLLKTGQYNQLQLAQMLEKSPSWINKRISLATRLHPSVREMVTLKQLCPQSAQEISKLPKELQYDFSTRIASDGIPKSAVEVLVATFNREECPSSFKEQILREPRHALLKLEKTKQIKTIRNQDKREIPSSNKTLRNDLVLLMRCIKDAEEQIGGLEEDDLKTLNSVVLSARGAMLRFCSLLEIVISSYKISPGKSSEEVN